MSTLNNAIKKCIVSGIFRLEFYQGNSDIVKQVSDEQFLLTSFSVASFISPSIPATLSIFFYDKSACSKARLLAFEKVRLSSKKLTMYKLRSSVQ